MLVCHQLIRRLHQACLKAGLIALRNVDACQVQLGEYARVRGNACC